MKYRRSFFKARFRGTAILAALIAFTIPLSGCSLYNEKQVTSEFIANKQGLTSSEIIPGEESQVTSRKEVWVEGEWRGGESDGSSQDSSSQKSDDDIEIIDLSAAKTSSIGFGFYGLDLGTYGFTKKWAEAMVAADYVNTIIGDVTSLEVCKKYNTKMWVSVHSIYESAMNQIEYGSDPAGWQAAFDTLNQSVINTGNQDACLGWYLNEPNNMAAVRAVSQYAAEKYKRRFFICFTVNAVSPRSYGLYQGVNKHTSRENTEYLTDVAFDCYWNVAAYPQMYQNMIDDLHNTTPKNARVWYIPGMYANDQLHKLSKDDIKRAGDAAVEHLQEMYKFLQAEPVDKRGGLMCFAYDFTSSIEHIYGTKQINEKTDDTWGHVLDECKLIGKEICTGKIG